VALASFCTYYDVAFPAISIHTLLSFIEFLLSSSLSVPTKTLQRYRQSARIRLFSIPNYPVCPVKAFGALQRSYPVLATDPFLSYRASGQLFLITQAHLRRSLKRLLLTLNLSPHLSFHSFRRSGASLAFASGVPFAAIQAHGTWASDSLWAYIDADARDTTVPRFFSSVFARM
jgi:integrase